MDNQQPERDKAKELVEWLDSCGYMDDEWILEQAQLSQHPEPAKAKQQVRDGITERFATALTTARTEAHAAGRAEAWGEAIKTVTLVPDRNQYLSESGIEIVTHFRKRIVTALEQAAKEGVG